MKKPDICCKEELAHAILICKHKVRVSCGRGQTGSPAITNKLMIFSPLRNELEVFPEGIDKDRGASIPLNAACPSTSLLSAIRCPEKEVFETEPQRAGACPRKVSQVPFRSYPIRDGDIDT